MNYEKCPAKWREHVLQTRCQALMIAILPITSRCNNAPRNAVEHKTVKRHTKKCHDQPTRCHDSVKKRATKRSVDPEVVICHELDICVSPDTRLDLEANLGWIAPQLDSEVVELVRLLLSHVAAKRDLKTRAHQILCPFSKHVHRDFLSYLTQTCGSVRSRRRSVRKRRGCSRCVLAIAPSPPSHVVGQR